MESDDNLFQFSGTANREVMGTGCAPKVSGEHLLMDLM